MKTLLLGVTGLCAGGAAWYMSDSPDFDRLVKKSPAQVYAAFSQLAQQGTITLPAQDGKGQHVSFRVDKVDGRSIHYEIRFDQHPVVVADLAFAGSVSSRFEVEAGRPLPPLGTRSMGVREASNRLETDPRYRRARAAAQQQAASRPMNNARPMVDPNRAADR